MKIPSFSYFPLIAFVAMTGSKLHATILLQDNFNTSAQSDDVNFEINGGRQSGTLAGTSYTQGAGSYPNGSTTDAGSAEQSQVTGGKLWLVSTAANNLSSISPNHNFNESPGIGGYLSISFDLNPNIGTGSADNWGAITFGASDSAAFGTAGSGARGNFINSATSHFGILFKDSGSYEAFNGSASTSGSFGLNPSGAIDTHHYEIRITGLIDGNPWDGTGDALIQAYRDNATAPFYTLTKTGGYVDNYITLQGYSSGYIAEFDNLLIQTVPEVSISALALISLGGMCFRRNRR